MHYLSKYGYVIKKEEISKDELNNLKHELRARPLQDSKFTYTQIDNSFPLYIETKNKIYIPKMYGIQKYGLPKKSLDNYIGVKWAKDIEFTGSLYEHQKEPVKLLLDQLESDAPGGILSLSTGGGKSISCLYVLSQLKGKTIIVVNKISLLKQWESEIKQFLPAARVGIIQGQANIDINDKDIIIAMLQSLSRIDYPDELFSDIRITVIDEIHNTSCKVFSKVLQKLSSKYTIGLTATPTRGDGCEYVFKWYIGDIVYKSDSIRQGLPPKIMNIQVNSEDYKESATVNRITGQKQIQFSTMMTDLIQMPKRNKLIVEILKHLYDTEKRKVLVLSERREHIVCLKKLLDSDDDVKFTYGLFMGQMKVTDLETAKKRDVIIATVQAFGEGVSEKDLNTLVLITPKKFIGHLKSTTKNESGKLEQIVGRIFRKEHVDICPLIIDLQDHFSVYKNQATQRRAFYKSHMPNAKIESYVVDLDESGIEEINFNCVKKKQTRKKEESLPAVDECLLID